MKFAILLFVSASMFASSAFAAMINSGKVNSRKGVIELNVSYGGGCAKHDFSLLVNPGCTKSIPAQCNATLVENANGDVCDAYITTDIEIPLQDTGLVGAFVGGSLLTIHGDNKTSVTVEIP